MYLQILLQIEITANNDTVAGRPAKFQGARRKYHMGGISKLMALYLQILLQSEITANNDSGRKTSKVSFCHI